jgi:hypothetical protein
MSDEIAEDGAEDAGDKHCTRAIAATLPLYERESGAKGDVHIWLEPHVVNQLRRLRGPGESFSDVILAAQD